MPSEEDDFFTSLNAEIQKHLERPKLAKKAQSAKRLAFDATVGQRVRDKAMKEYLELQAMIDLEIWESTGIIALFTEQRCDGCGSIHTIFLQYMEHQRQRTRPSNQRSKRIAMPTPGLPRSTVVQVHRTHICADCCDDHGFELESAPQIHLFNGALAVSSTYMQEDINATTEEG